MVRKGLHSWGTGCALVDVAQSYKILRLVSSQRPVSKHAAISARLSLRPQSYTFKVKPPSFNSLSRKYRFSFMEWCKTFVWHLISLFEWSSNEPPDPHSVSTNLQSRAAFSKQKAKKCCNNWLYCIANTKYWNIWIFRHKFNWPHTFNTSSIYFPFTQFDPCTRSRNTHLMSSADCVSGQIKCTTNKAKQQQAQIQAMNLHWKKYKYETDNKKKKTMNHYQVMSWWSLCIFTENVAQI